MVIWILRLYNRINVSAGGDTMKKKKGEWDWDDFDWGGCDEDWHGDAD